ncbi:MAG: lysine--tRNA ligase [Candidatus Portnoybacteria bacterium CG10_big_fil_rev_8_21_14_0_10_44_7]|uniref:Lysine--tRNA ligase n=1 Tax=Candidatus Portnoybacteria bacterium CG10_big_fil_rev_8_21_14_0_10_44_7 TaxID=1974816 RepID=A0A2M8KID3_9BACT|nr:MAG: lysine--tRNA ligase [Candidatus Portnoybacteria bacterium CG10_big_fil_rev_8_21_14_0_10_44_7]
MAKLEELKQIKQKKLVALKKAGIDPYPDTVGNFIAIKDLLTDFKCLTQKQKKVFLVGRIMLWRPQGGLIFGQLRDQSGQIQFFVSKKDIGEKEFALWQNLEIGDFLRLGGKLFLTKRGERTVNVSDFKILSKALTPLPEKWAGLQDMEKRLRQRYLDLLLNQKAGEIFKRKTLFWQSAREFLTKQGFLEVETPILEMVPGGAEAEPFLTHYNALGQDLYLRISLELPLKKLLVGGLEKVFEIGRVFRNEGMDAEHLQDYTSLEFYWAYHNLADLQKIVQEFFRFIIKKTVGRLQHQYQGQKISWAKNFAQIDYFALFQKNVGLDLSNASDADLRAKIKLLKLKTGLDINKLGRGRMIDLLYKKICRPKIIQPSFLLGHPVEVSPLAKRDPQKPGRVLRLQPVAGGVELGNGFAELNDPLEQRQRFEQQMKLRQAGDKEAQILDDDFLTALEYGMPPAAGFGFSERLFAFLLDKSVRETTIFPAVKNKEH